MRASPSIVIGFALITTLGAPSIAQSGRGAPSAAPADTAPAIGHALRFLCVSHKHQTV